MNDNLDHECASCFQLIVVLLLKSDIGFYSMVDKSLYMIVASFIVHPLNKLAC